MNKNSMDQALLEQLKTRLETSKTSLEKELSGFAKKDEEIEGDWNAKYPNRENGNMEEEADEMQEYENLLSLEHNLEIRLKDVNVALEKISKETYGKCEKCGKEIEEARLEANPEARLCMNCNKQS